MPSRPLQRYFELTQEDEERQAYEDDEEDVLFEDELAPLPSLETGHRRPGPLELQAPIVNPMRNVGRNDPCPCGKKAKRCCLAA